MAEIVEKNEVKKETTKQTTVATNPVTTKQSAMQMVKSTPIGVRVALIVLAFFALLGLMAVCYATMHRFQSRFDGDDMMRGRYNTRVQDDQFGSGRGMRSGMMNGQGDFGPMGVNTTVSNRVNGVVTSVEGNTITVAGNGTTTNVTVTDATTYAGATKPAAVNDTIVAFGTKNSDGTFAANSVRLIRQ